MPNALAKQAVNLPCHWTMTSKSNAPQSELTEYWAQIGCPLIALVLADLSMHEIPEVIGEHEWAIQLRMTPRLSEILSGHRFFFGDRSPEQTPYFQFDKVA